MQPLFHKAVNDIHSCHRKILHISELMGVFSVERCCE